MASDPLVSIVIPVYNHAPYVRDCLNSVFKQEYQRLQLVVIDDGSTDGSPEIVAQHLKDSPYPYQFSTQRNQGAHHTINKAIKKSRGEYVAILNSDDRYHPGRIFALMDELEASPARLAFSKVRHINAAGNPLPPDAPHVFYYQRSLAASQWFPTRSFELLRGNIAVTTGNLFFHRTLYYEVGRFANYLVCHDWDFVLQSILIEEPLFVDQTLLDYRVHAANTTKQYEMERRKEADRVLSSYLKAVPEAENELVPGPEAWGPYWDLFVDVYLRHLSQYPETWQLLQESRSDVREKMSGLEGELAHTLRRQAEAYFKLSEQMENIILHNNRYQIQKESPFSLLGWIRNLRRVLTRIVTD